MNRAMAVPLGEHGAGLLHGSCSVAFVGILPRFPVDLRRSRKRRHLRFGYVWLSDIRGCRYGVVVPLKYVSAFAHTRAPTSRPPLRPCRSPCTKWIPP